MAKRKPETPLELVEEMIGKLGEWRPEWQVLVMGDLGFLEGALSRTSEGNVTFAVCDDSERGREHERWCQEAGMRSLRWTDPLLKGMQFDVVMGNPPYQPPVNKTGKGSGSGNKIWHRFVERAFELCKQDGHILMVTPNNWRRGNFRNGQHRQAQELMWLNSILWVKDAKPHFPDIGHSIMIDAWHVWKNGRPTTTGYLTVDQHRLWPMDRTRLAILEKFFDTCHGYVEGDTIEAQFDYQRSGTNYVDIRDDDHPFKYARTSAQLSRGCVWTNKRPLNYERKKVFFSDSGDLGAFFLDEPCGACQHFLVADHEEGDHLVTFMKGNLVRFVIDSFMIEGAMGVPIEFVSHFPRAVLTSDDPLREVFGLTPEEIELISKG